MQTDQRSDPEEPWTDGPDLGSWVTDADEPFVAEDVEDSPRDTPLAVTDYGTTEYEESHPEPLTARLKRELPDIPMTHRPVDPDRVTSSRPAGRLVIDGDPTLADGDTGGLAAEEAAVHLTPGPEAPGPPDSRGRRRDP